METTNTGKNLEQTKIVAKYGTWKSPFTSEIITEGKKDFVDVVIDGSDIYWQERRPEESGRSVIVRRDSNGKITDITPSFNKNSTDFFNVRTKVHEYGGSSFTVKNSIVYFVNFSDQIIYIQTDTKPTPEPLTKPGIRYTDLKITKRGLIAIGEKHGDPKLGAKAVENFIALINLKTGENEILCSGKDFYAYPSISPDQNKIAWIEWNHPNMPWDVTELWLADISGKKLENATKVAGNGKESILEPTWRQDNTLFFVTDRNNWWNIYKLDKSKTITPVYTMDAEFSGSMWVHGITHWSFHKDNIIAKFSQNSFSKLASINSNTGEFKELDVQGVDFAQIKISDNFAVLIRGFVNSSNEVIKLNLDNMRITTLAKSNNKTIDPGYISEAKPIKFTSSNGRIAYALYYPPKNKDYMGSENSVPALIVDIHGGPTANTTPSFSAKVQYWTSRGFALADINYGGSTGYGREYRELLKNNWGVVDVEDCENAAKYLYSKGLVDKNKLAIHGGSAGGYTTLAALTFGNVFTAGASYYGVSDLKALAEDTHKFESRYLDGLLGSYPEKSNIYYNRSPINFVARLNKPIIFFQGDEDEIVPLNQATIMHEALKKQGVKTELVIYKGEQHGFRKAKNIQDALEKELDFLLEVFYNS